ncbi:MAG: HlyD family efflux transporter periplasmic adaptor subunit [Sideroxydans sp.]|nr:HlyD family efflux transporter periplasmic adaptor subunit [Sideroxydans sp.]
MNPSRLLLLALSCALLAACGESAAPFYQGYAEGEWLYLAAPQGGYLETLNVARGARATKGGKAFTLSSEQNAARNDSSTAALEAQLRAAESALKFANAQLKRQQELAKQNFASASRTDELLSAQSQAAAQVRVLREQLGNKTVQIPESGEVSETYYRPGEWVPPGQPVMSLLPDDKRRIRFFVPETQLANTAIGQSIEARCDGCAAPIAATINFIAAQAEYTPPVIYSQGSREKLVFRVEAIPSPQDAARLRPGLPLEVTLK